MYGVVRGSQCLHGRREAQYRPVALTPSGSDDATVCAAGKIRMIPGICRRSRKLETEPTATAHQRRSCEVQSAPELDGHEGALKHHDIAAGVQGGGSEGFYSCNCV